ncbi:MAG: hypothetical protein P4L50_19040 [Anaerolineaceae bacterium]|nr:hypothetical protein [Anaerolineaceae bacterium]
MSCRKDKRVLGPDHKYIKVVCGKPVYREGCDLCKECFYADSRNAARHKKTQVYDVQTKAFQYWKDYTEEYRAHQETKKEKRKIKHQCKFYKHTLQEIRDIVFNQEPEFAIANLKMLFEFRKYNPWLVKDDEPIEVPALSEESDQESAKECDKDVTIVKRKRCRRNTSSGKSKKKAIDPAEVSSTVAANEQGNTKANTESSNPKQ